MLHITKKTYQDGIKVHETRQTSCEGRGRLVDELNTRDASCTRQGLPTGCGHRDGLLQSLVVGASDDYSSYTIYTITDDDGYLA